MKLAILLAIAIAVPCHAADFAPSQVVAMYDKITPILSTIGHYKLPDKSKLPRIALVKHLQITAEALGAFYPEDNLIEVVDDGYGAAMDTLTHELEHWVQVNNLSVDFMEAHRDRMEAEAEQASNLYVKKFAHKVQ